MRWIRIAISLLLLIIGALLGDGYKNSLYLYWLSVSAILVIYAEIITTTLINTKEELGLYKGKVTSLTVVKENGGSIVQISVSPQSEILVGRQTQLDVYIMFATSLPNIPDMKIKTDIPWNIEISNQKQQSRNFAGKFEYILNNPMIKKIDDKFLKYSFFVTIDQIGDHKFIIEIDSGSLKSEISNSLNVRSA